MAIYTSKELSSQVMIYCTRAPSLFPRRRPLLAYSVEKLCFTVSENFSRNFLRPGAQLSDRMSGSEVRQERISSVLRYPLVSSVRKLTEIANENLPILKTEFFNTIGHEQPVNKQFVTLLGDPEIIVGYV